MNSLVALWGNTQILPNDPHFIAMITLAYIRKKKAALIFCPMRADCERMAENIASKLPYQFVEYERVPTDDNGKIRLNAPQLEFTELADELKDIVT